MNSNGSALRYRATPILASAAPGNTDACAAASSNTDPGFSGIEQHRRVRRSIEHDRRRQQENNTKVRVFPLLFKNKKNGGKLSRKYTAASSNLVEIMYSEENFADEGNDFPPNYSYLLKRRKKWRNYRVVFLPICDLNRKRGIEVLAAFARKPSADVFLIARGNRIL